MPINHISHKVILFSIVLLFGLQISLYPLSLAYSSGPTPIGTWEPADSLDDVMDVVINGNFAYIAVNSFGLQILDITDPTTPTERGTYSISGVINCIDYANNRVYIGVSSALYILDVTNPDSPSLNTTIAMGSTVYGVAVDFPYIYVGAYSQSFKIANQTDVISTPSWNPNDYWCFGVDFTGNYVYGATSSKGVTVWDVSDKENPVKLDNVVLGDNIYSVAVISSAKVVAGGRSGYIALVDSSNPNNLQKLGDTDTGGGDIEDLVVSGNYAFVADWSLGTCSVSVSDNTPSPINRMQPTTRGEGIYTDGTYVYGANNWEFDIYDLSSSVTSGGIFEDIPGFAILFTFLTLCAMIFYL
ncbi:MAG: hypothetical protein ACTSQI_17380, partial [Candidatus Helarchaeota archaeon]